MKLSFAKTNSFFLSFVIIAMIQQNISYTKYHRKNNKQLETQKEGAYKFFFFSSSVKSPDDYCLVYYYARWSIILC